MSNLQLSLIQENLILQLGTVGPPGPAGGGDDTEARAAIGWPYTDTESISARLDTSETGTLEIETAIGWPYTNTTDINARLVALESGSGVDQQARNAIGWPYTDVLTIEERLTGSEDNIVDIDNQIVDIFDILYQIGPAVTALDEAVGTPWTLSTSIKDTIGPWTQSWPDPQPAIYSSIASIIGDWGFYDYSYTIAEAVNANLTAIGAWSNPRTIVETIGVNYTSPQSLNTRVNTLEGRIPLTVAGTSGQITVTNNPTTNLSTFSIPNPFIVPGDATVLGNVNVNGTLNYTNVTDLNISDNIINLNYGVTGTPSLNAFINIVRGNQPDVAILWNESALRWQVGPRLDSNSWVNLLVPGDLNTINNTLTSYGTRITTAEGSITTLQSTTVSLQNQINTTNSTLTTVHGEVTTLQGQMTTVQGQITTINSTIAALPTKLAFDIGNGTDTTYTITHNKNTLHIIVQVFDNVTGQVVYPDVVRTTVNAITVTFANPAASNRYDVVIY